MRLLLLLAAAATLAAAEPRTFHLAPDGDDARDGATPATAWRSLARIDALELHAGDRVTLAAGEYRGSLHLDRADGGTAEHPVVIAGAGRGRTVIVSPDAAAITVAACAGLEIRGLSLRGEATAARKGHAGIACSTDDGDGRRLPHLVIEDVEATGFGADGIAFGSWNEALPGWDDVEIRGCDCSGNFGSGITSYDITGQHEVGGSHRRVHLADCVADRNRGSGIVLGGVDGGLVERCRAIGTDGPGGCVGIWAYASRALVFDRCISAGTRTAGNDGGGFDLDGGCQDCVVQRCLSYDNAGIGFMHCDFPNARPTRGNVIRFCASVDDGRKHVGGTGLGFVTWGAGIEDCAIHSCVVWADQADLGANPLLLAAYLKGYEKPGDEQHLRGCEMRGNIVVARAPGAVLVEDELPDPDPTQVRFVGNWYAGNGGFAAVPGAERAKASAWDTLAAWREATGQEREGGVATGGEGDATLSPPAAERPTEPSALAGLGWFRPTGAVAALRIPRDRLPGLPADATDFAGTALPAGDLRPGIDQAR